MAPYLNQGQVMRDLEAVIGGKYYDSEESSLEDIMISDVGLSNTILVSRFSGTITGNKDDNSKKRIAKRVERLEEELKGEESEFMKKNIRERIAQLTHGFAIVKVGALTTAERKRKFDKAEDAVHSVRGAMEEGVVKGGGQTLKIIAEGMDDDSILKRALMAPYNQIMENAGEIFEIEDWVKNSTKGERVSLQNACEIALNLSTICGVSANEKPKSLDTLLGKSQVTKGE